MKRSPFAAIAVLVCAPALFAASQGGALSVPLPLFPPNNWWNTDVTSAPVDASSASYITFINNGGNRALHPDWGGNVGDGTTYGFPFIQVDGSQPKLTVTFDTPDESDGVDHTTETSIPFYPVPPEAITTFGWIEEGEPGNIDRRAVSDRHMLIVDTTNNTLYELYNVFYNGANWQAGSGAFFDMKTNNRRPDTWTSADAAGLAILPGLVRYDEVYGPTEINHALRFTVRATNGYVYPASHNAGATAGALPMGARLRLKASTNISTFSADVQKIFRAFKKYGLIVADNGTDMYISGTYDTRWDMDLMNTAFGQLHANDFEVVELGWAPPTSFIVTVPSTTASGDAASITVTAYDQNYNVATGYRGTIHFTSTDGAATLPTDYAFTSGDNGAHTFANALIMRTSGAQEIAATDVSNATVKGLRMLTVLPPAPTGVIATAATSTRINISWNAVTGATYEITRSPAFGAPVTTTATSYPDMSVMPDGVYIYRVRAVDGGARQSPFSTADVATTFTFTEDPLVAASTVIKAMHVTELRNAVNAFRTAAGLGTTSFTDAMLTNVAAKTTHVDELRSSVNAARGAIGLTAMAFTDPTLTSSTLIKAAHLQELRNALK